MTDQPLSIVAGPPLSEEPGLGALTLSGWLREVTTRSGPAEALVMYEGDSVTRWTYDDLWTRANAVARALIACGVGKGTRVGILMTNRPEFLAAAFGTALAGGVAATLSTFSTPAELDHLLQSSACHVLLMERTVLKKDFAAILTDLEPGISTASPGALASPYFPFLRHIASLGGGEGMIEPWDRFLTRGDSIDQALIDATAATVTPADPGVLSATAGRGSARLHRDNARKQAHRGHRCPGCHRGGCKLWTPASNLVPQIRRCCPGAALGPHPWRPVYPL